MICKNCGCDLPEEAKFCFQCGNSVMPSDESSNVAISNDDTVVVNGEDDLKHAITESKKIILIRGDCLSELSESIEEKINQEKHNVVFSSLAAGTAACFALSGHPALAVIWGVNAGLFGGTNMLLKSKGVYYGFYSYAQIDDTFILFNDKLFDDSQDVVNGYETYLFPKKLKCPVCAQKFAPRKGHREGPYYCMECQKTIIVRK